MRTLVRDCTVHPLLPGSVLASIMGDPPSRDLQPWDYATLASFNKKSTLDIIAHFQTIGMISDEQAAKLIGTDTQFVTAFRDLQKRMPEAAQVTLCDRDSIERLGRALFSARLLA